MSRGLGKLQKIILEHLQDDGATTIESARWELLEGGGTDRLPDGWNVCVWRAMKSLAARREIITDKRPLRSIEEWQKHYPNKTFDARVRNARHKLLPIITGDPDIGRRLLRRYNDAGREEFALAQHEADMRRSFRGEWGLLEVGLRSVYAGAGSTSLFELIARGAQLFGSAAVTADTSFAAAARRCLKDPLLPAALASQLDDFCLRVFPPEEISRLGLKCYIRAIAGTVPDRGHCSLSDEVVDVLFKAEPHYFSQLPGFAPAKRERDPDRDLDFTWDRSWRPTHSDIVRKVLDQSAFHPFTFVVAA